MFCFSKEQYTILFKKIIKTDQALFVCLLNHSDMIIDIKVHGGLLLFYFVSVLSITNHEKQEQNRVHNKISE